MSRPTEPGPIDLAAYDFALPGDRIAQEPPIERDGARLLRLDRASGAVGHARLRDLPGCLAPGDLLVVNTSRVLAARLRGHKATGGHAEALLLAPLGAGRYRALLRARGRLRIGQKLVFARDGSSAEAEIAALEADGAVVLAFADDASPYALGEMPLPPYIHRPAPQAADAERYQTVFAREPGSVAAPTAGLHLSQALLAALATRGVSRADVVLHVGAGTFRPLGTDQLARRRLHPEAFVLPECTARAIARTRERGGRVVAAGTTTTRVLEGRADGRGGVVPGEGVTELFLAPGDPFQVVDALLTNFHLPRSSLLLLVAAFAGREPVLRAYAEAIASGYHFYSYGDAMLVQ